jgi:hypothetical protein
MKEIGSGLGFSVKRHYQQYFSTSLRSTLLVEKTEVLGENH